MKKIFCFSLLLISLMISNLNVFALKMNVNNENCNMEIVENFENNSIPRGFVKSKIKYNGETYIGISNTKANIKMLYLKNNLRPYFYIYENGKFYSFFNVIKNNKMFIGISNYKNIKTPFNFEKKTVLINNRPIKGFISKDDKDIMLIYAKEIPSSLDMENSSLDMEDSSLDMEDSSYKMYIYNLKNKSFINIPSLEINKHKKININKKNKKINRNQLLGIKNIIIVIMGLIILFLIMLKTRNKKNNIFDLGEEQKTVNLNEKVNSNINSNAKDVTGSLDFSNDLEILTIDLDEDKKNDKD